MPFHIYKIKIDGGYKCALCGKEVLCDFEPTASSAMTNHIKSKHPKEYEEATGHPPIWRR